MPGQANTVSTTTATLIMMTRLMPASVSTGIRAFLKACLPMTSDSGRPLRRASLMYSEPSTSSMEERVSRMWAAAKYQPSAKAGISRCQHGARARRWQPLQVHREEQDQHEADPERGQRQAEQREYLARPIPEAADPHRGENAARDADQQREGHGRQRQQQRVRQAREVELEHRRAVVERLAEIAMGEAGHEAPVLDPDRLIEAEPLANSVDVGLAGSGLHQQCGWVARSRGRTGRWSATAEAARAASSRSAERCSAPWRPLRSPLFARQRDVLVGRRVGVAGDQAEPRLPNPRTGAVDEGQLPDMARRSCARARAACILCSIAARFLASSSAACCWNSASMSG